MDTTTTSHVSPWLKALIWPFYHIFLRLYYRLELIHADRIPKTGPVILAPTHRARWDPVLMGLLTSRTLRFMASHDEFVGLQGWMMKRFGAFPVNTSRPGPSVLKHCQQILKSGEILVIFPEGTIYYYAPHQVHPLKPGTAWIALDAQSRLENSNVQIIPIRMVYSRRFIRFRSTVRIEVREPIALEPYLDAPRKEAVATLTRDLQSALGDRVNYSIVERVPSRESGLPVDRDAILNAEFQGEPVEHVEVGPAS